MIQKIVIQNYRIFRSFEFAFHDGLNIVVGDNETGKSTLLEAIHLALSKRLHGKLLDQELTPYLFNKAAVLEYLESIRKGKPIAPPSIVIELYLSDVPEFAALRGTMNSSKQDCIGIKIEIETDPDYRDEYRTLILEKGNELTTVPVEYYRAHWRSFANAEISPRGCPVRASYVDATSIRLQSGTDYYLQDIIKTGLDSKERIALNLAYRRLKEAFANEAAVKSINTTLSTKKGSVTDKDLALGVDLSTRSGWDTSLVPHLDDVPFGFIGNGQQNTLKIMLALDRKAVGSDIILVEEPENHLSFSSMNVLIGRVQEKCAGKQMFVSTHSAYVLNKLGLASLILLRNGAAITLKDLSADTQEYFQKLAGYDTLRLVLAKKAILVEGPSDELVVQKAYAEKHGKRPIENGVDVISVGLSFLRFLEIARALGIPTRVVTDNDGKVARVDRKFAAYKGVDGIGVFRSDDESAPTLEPQLIRANGLKRLNDLFSSACATVSELAEYMEDRKTECALQIFRSGGITYPQYILDAVEQQ